MSKKVKKGISLKINPMGLLKFGLVAAVLGHIYYPTFLWMIQRWSARDSYYGHGFLIPIVAIYWILRKRRSLQADKPEFKAIGAAFLCAGAVIQITSSVLRIYFLSGISFVLVLIGCIDLLIRSC